MREPFASLLATGAGKLALSLLVVAAPHAATAFTFKQVPSPRLNINDLGRVAFAGDFDAVSLYEYEGQTQETPNIHGALLSRYPNGVFASINTTDADIRAMCSLRINGTERVVFAGNFTGVGSMPTPGGIALLNITSGSVQALPGLTGSVNTLYCDRDAGQLYVGGSFTGLNSSNAIVWNNGWQDLSFEGFNGAVHSVTKAPNGNIVFAGEFSGLGGNATVASENSTQIINIGTSNITAQTSSGLPGFTDPNAIACKSDFSVQGADQTWLLSDNAPGFWKADFGFGFEPTRLKLYNTDFQGRGTKTWRFTALPDGGIMNMTYTDPSNGQQRFCDATCPLPQGNTTAQEFTFVNVVGMNSFRLDISDWYGSGAGLNGIQLFQDNIFAYAIGAFNEPRNCGPSTARSEATVTGNWQVTPSHNSYSQYLTTVLQGDPIDTQTASVAFRPDIKQSGNYSVTIYTPGCQGDGTCGSRGRVNVTVQLSQTQKFETILWQTNLFDKYDEVYNGFMDASSDFRPTVILRAAPGQGPTPLTVVAQRVRFSLLKATSGNINGLFEYKPGQKLEDLDISSSVINSAGASLSPRERALLTSLATNNQDLYVGGAFTDGGSRNNIFLIRQGAKEATALPGKGLNNQVMTMFRNDSILYVGGNFTNNGQNNAQGLNGVAALVNNNQWQPLGAGVNGVVLFLVPFSLNVTANTPEQVLAVSGFFDRVNAFGNNSVSNVQNFAIWVPSRGNWLHNLDFHSLAMSGRLMTFADVPGSDRWFAGSVSSGSLLASGSAELRTNGNNGRLSLGAFPIKMEAQQTKASRKRAILQGQDLNMTGVRTGMFYNENGMNKTILAGHFEVVGGGADDQNITNVLIIDGANGDRVTGFGGQLDRNSTFSALAVLDNILYAGGMVTGRLGNNRVGGIVAYDLSSGKYPSTQPPPLQGQNVTVNAIAPRPKSQDVYIAGQFQSAGNLGCAAVCIWNTERNQWSGLGNGLSGTVSSLTWIADTKLVIAGNLTSGNNQTTILTYDSSSNQFTEVAGANDLPGPVNALTIATNTGEELWVAGLGNDRSPYLRRFDGTKWKSVDNKLFGDDTDIRGIQVLSLSENHDQSDLIDQSQDLLLMGQIHIANFGFVSGALFNGTGLTPFILSTKGVDGTTKNGRLSSVFVENPNSFFLQSKKHLPVWAVVLISLAIALVLTFLLVVAGFLVEWYRKKSKGYIPAPTYSDRPSNMGRLPPEQLFGTLSGPRAPAI